MHQEYRDIKHHGGIMVMQTLTGVSVPWVPGNGHHSCQNVFRAIDNAGNVRKTEEKNIATKVKRMA